MLSRDQWVAVGYALSFWLMGVIGVLAGMVLEKVLSRDE